MLRRTFPLALAGLLALSCHLTAVLESPMDIAPDEAFSALGNDFLEGFLRRNPVAASGLGDHRFDDRWPDVTPEAEAEELAWLDSVQARLAALPSAELGPEQQVDAAILEHEIAATKHGIQRMNPWERDPAEVVQLVGAGLDGLASREYAPAHQRAAALRARLAAVPPLLGAAEARLGSPSELHTRTAIEQAGALADWIGGPLIEAFPEQERAGLAPAAAQAEQAVRGFVAFLEGELLPRSTGEFRLGPALWEEQLRYTLDTTMTSGEVLAEAWALMDRTTEEMARDAATLYPQLFPDEPLPDTSTAEARRALVRRVLDRLAEDHPDDDTIIADAERTLVEATAFVRDHGLVGLPEEPVSVIVMPEFKRGVAIAYCDAPGPLEESRETFYAIAPPPLDWPAERRESFYREYNAAMLQELTIHEAMPGHFLQLAHAARFDSPVRAVFGSGTFVEGWALYSEWMMAEHGYGGPAVRLQREKMVLRLCLNAILDHGVHVGGMGHDEAVAMMVERGFQEEGEAEGKWKRACLTSTQLSTYLVGLLEVLALRQAAERTLGADFDERAFNDSLIAHGSPPPRHLAALLGLDLGR